MAEKALFKDTIKLGGLNNPPEKPLHTSCSDGEIEVLNNRKLVLGENVFLWFLLEICRLWLVFKLTVLFGTVNIFISNVVSYGNLRPRKINR